MGRRPRKNASRRWLKPTGDDITCIFPNRVIQTLRCFSGVSISDMTAMDSKYDYEYLIKFKNLSFLHVQWLTAQDIG
jgi:chorismate mutase